MATTWAASLLRTAVIFCNHPTRTHATARPHNQLSTRFANWRNDDPRCAWCSGKCRFEARVVGDSSRVRVVKENVCASTTHRSIVADERFYQAAPLRVCGPTSLIDRPEQFREVKELGALVGHTDIGPRVANVSHVMVRRVVCWRPVCKDRHHPNLKTFEIGLFPHGNLQKVPRSVMFAASVKGAQRAAASRIRSEYPSRTVCHLWFGEPLPIGERTRFSVLQDDGKSASLIPYFHIIVNRCANTRRLDVGLCHHSSTWRFISAFFDCDLPLQCSPADPASLLMEENMSEADNNAIAEAFFA